MTKIEFYVGTQFDKHGSNLSLTRRQLGLKQIDRILTKEFEGFTTTSARGTFENFAPEEVNVYSVITDKPVDYSKILEIAGDLAVQLNQKTVLFFITQGSGGFS